MCEISILIPVYNGEETIEKCLDSVFNQTFNDFNIIIGNDESTDNTLEILKKYKNIKVYTKRRTTIGDMRNYLIGKCRTKYFMFIDSDDLLEKNCIELLYKEIKNEDCDMVMGLTDKVISEKIILNDNNKFDYLFNNKIPYFVASWNKLFKTKLFKNIKYPSYSLAEDEFVIHYILKDIHKIIILPNKTYNYVPLGLSKKILSNYNEGINALKDRYFFFKNTEYEKKMYRRLVNYMIEVYDVLRVNNCDTTLVVEQYKKIYELKNSNFKDIIFRISPSFLFRLQLLFGRIDCRRIKQEMDLDV